MSGLRDTWDRLELEGESSAGYVRLRISPADACAVYAARRLTDGLETLMLELDTASLPGRIRYPRTRGFDVEPTVLTAGPKGRTRVNLQLSENRYREVFHALCEDVVDGMLVAGSQTAAVEKMVERLVRWQAFLGRHGPDGLPPEARRGLFGELWFLAEYLLPAISKEESVTAWVGPAGAGQDFQLDVGLVEVKTTIAVTPHHISISNAAQLEARLAPRLVLLFLVMDESEGHGTTLVDMIDTIRDNLDGELRDRFEDRLQMSGYLDIQRALYSRPRYHVVRLRCFDVVEGFPRLIVDDLPDGIEQVRYKIALAACKDHEIETGDVRSWLAGGAS